MKYFKLVVIMLLVVGVVTTAAFATGAKVKKAVAEDNKTPLIVNEAEKAGIQQMAVPTMVPNHPPTPETYAGIKHVGAAQVLPQWQTLKNALMELMWQGVTVGGGGVTLLLDDPLYTETGVAVGVINGASALDPVVIKPNAGMTPVLNLTVDPSFQGALVMLGTKYLTIEGTAVGSPAGQRDMTVQMNPAQAFPASYQYSTVKFRNGVDHVGIQDCKVYGMYDLAGTTANAAIAAFTYAGGPGNSHITVKNNLITTCSYAVLFAGAAGGANFDTGNIITLNDIGGLYGPTGGANQTDYCEVMGIRSEWAVGAQITHNNVRGVHRNNSAIAGTFSAHRTAGIFANYSVGSLIAYNTIDDIRGLFAGTSSSNFRVYGLRVFGLTPEDYLPLTGLTKGNNQIYNNGITQVFGNGTTAFRDFGLSLENGYGDTLRYNSIYMTGVGTSGAVCAQITGNGQITAVYTRSALASLDNNAFMNDRVDGVISCIFRPFNNSGLADITHSNHNVIHIAGPDGVIDAAGTPDLPTWTANTTLDSNSSENDPAFLAPGNVHINTLVPSAAEGLGIPFADILDDVDLQPRDLSHPDAGYDTFGGIPFALDVKPQAVGGLAASGIPIAIPATPSVFVKNNTPFGVAGFNVNVVVKDELANIVPGGGTVLSGALAAWEVLEVTGFTPFTPTSNGPYELTITTQLFGDLNTGNDVLTVSQPIVPKVVLPPGGKLWTFDDSASSYGWSGTYDFELSGAFTKLGGVYGGSGRTWVTVPGPPGTPIRNIQDDGATETNFIYSPFLNLSAMTGNVYISFFHSIETEPSWDMSTLQVTVDSGKTWQIVGLLDDPNGINWYDPNVYQNAGGPPQGIGTLCLDIATWMLFGLYNDIPIPPARPRWSSNGDCKGADVPTGPFGYVFVQLKYNAIARKPAVRFRYNGFSDYGTSFDGFAFDNFKISPAGATFAGGVIQGTQYVDVDGSSTINGGDTPEAGVQMDLRYFNVHMAYATTDAQGQYSFGPLQVKLPGTYQVYANKAGEITDFPASPAGTFPYVGFAEVTNQATGDTVIGVDLANYVGSISGMKFSDLDDDHLDVETGEPGLGGWTIEAADGASGATAYSKVTDASGNYTILAVPNIKYVVKEVQQTNFGRATFPNTSGQYDSIYVGGPSGGTGAVVDSMNFGNYIYGTVILEAVIDQNGDGHRDGADLLALPIPLYQVFQTYKNGSFFQSDTLGQGVAFKKYGSLDIGTTMAFKRITGAPTGYTETSLIDTFYFALNSGGLIDTARGLYFKQLFVTGVKYEDLNGNGVKDALEPGLPGWTINLSGVGGGTTATDSLGGYRFDGVGPFAHTISEVLQSGWTQTAPVGGVYNFTPTQYNHNETGKNFGNFKNVCISGLKYRDRNQNHQKDLGEEPLSEWVISLTKCDSTHTDTLHTLADGTFQFCNIPPGCYIVWETVKPGWTQTAPYPAYVYNINLTSGTNVTGLEFGNFAEGDTAKYRTFTYAQLMAATEATPAKRPKTGKAILGPPNSANLITDIITGGGLIRVGLPGVMNAGNKEKTYLQPKKQGDVYTTFANKAKAITPHIGGPRGFDTDVKGALMLKKWTAMPATKKNDILVANLLALQVSLTSSVTGHTPAGLGSLMYYQPGQPYSGLTIDQIEDTANVLMTKWEGVPYSSYIALDSVVAKILDAFKGPSTNDTTTTGGWTAPKLVWKAYTSAYGLGFIHVNPGVAPKNRLGNPENQTPVVYNLAQNYPNPFNPTTTLGFDLPKASYVTLKIYNVLGQEVATLLDRQMFNEGSEEVEFDASSLSSGVYLYRIVAEPVTSDGGTSNIFTQVKKMVLLK